MKAKNARNQSKVNRAVKHMIRHNNLNDQRNAADGNDEKLYRKLDRQCSNSFDKYLEAMDELPKYEQKAIEAADARGEFDQSFLNNQINQSNQIKWKRNYQFSRDYQLSTSTNTLRRKAI